jgi:two-component system, NarL family, response regulator LiaR
MRADKGGVIRIVLAQSLRPLRVLLIDDHMMVAKVLAARLSVAEGIWVAGPCSATDPNLPDIVRQPQPDVITIEVEPFGPATGKVLRGLIAARPDAKVVVLSAESDIALALDAARAGAAAWVAKRQSATELEAIILGVHRGESWYPRRCSAGSCGACAPTSLRPAKTRMSWTC